MNDRTEKLLKWLDQNIMNFNLEAQDFQLWHEAVEDLDNAELRQGCKYFMGHKDDKPHPPRFRYKALKLLDAKDAFQCALAHDFSDGLVAATYNALKKYKKWNVHNKDYLFNAFRSHYIGFVNTAFAKRPKSIVPKIMPVENINLPENATPTEHIAEMKRLLGKHP